MYCLNACHCCLYCYSIGFWILDYPIDNLLGFLIRKTKDCKTGEEVTRLKASGYHDRQYSDISVRFELDLV